MTTKTVLHYRLIEHTDLGDPEVGPVAPSVYDVLVKPEMKQEIDSKAGQCTEVQFIKEYETDEELFELDGYYYEDEEEYLHELDCKEWAKYQVE